MLRDTPEGAYPLEGASAMPLHFAPGTMPQAVGEFFAQKSPAGENIAWKNHFHGINHFRL
jgi:hypothetical protein